MAFIFVCMSNITFTGRFNLKAANAQAVVTIEARVILAPNPPPIRFTSICILKSETQHGLNQVLFYLIPHVISVPVFRNIKYFRNCTLNA